MHPFYPFIFLFLLLAAGQESSAQNYPDEPPDPANINYQLTGLKMSENGRWLTAWKSYDLNRDTLLIFDSRIPGKPLTYRTKVNSIFFIGESQLLIVSSTQAELIKLPEITSTSYKGVKNAKVLEAQNRFLLHYNADEQNKLELRHTDGILINEISRVIRLYSINDDTVYAIAENEQKGVDVLSINELSIENLYHTEGRISSLDIAPGQSGLIIHEQSPDDSSQDLVYLDISTKSTYSLQEVLAISFQRAFTEMIGKDSIYFLKLIVPAEKQKDAIVDVWQNNDFRLDEKFYVPVHTLTYVWKPRKQFIQKVGTDRLPVTVNTGHKQYFLCMDPNELQDYRSEYPPLQLNVFDLEKDSYTLLDTIAPQCYLSKNGCYALSPAKGGWSLYYLPSKSKQFIKGEHLDLPWFTSDDKTVIFEGQGAVWLYDIKTAKLSKAAAFEGYKTRILNGKRIDIPVRKSRFSRQQVDLSEPLLIELYDPQNNLAGYSLWHNGETKVIVPPTNHCIRSLTCNQQFRCFSWLEEDYNLPPGLVYKEAGKTEKVLYQSNKQDQAILSLKQNIISYTNRNGIPLKGILYYPLNFDRSQKYPMIVHIYEKQNQLANRYLYPTYYESLGFNIRLLLENEYFVYMPDINIEGKAGPGIDALDCVTRALDAINNIPMIDRERIGLIGHSFGGYETDYIATRCDRFAAFVSGSGHSDIVWDSNSFNYNFHIPDYVRIEANMYKMGDSFSTCKSLYFKNNPVYHAEKVIAPVLLWTGTEDQNVTADHTMAFYNALRRNQKDVIALFYKGEGHFLTQKQAQHDLTCRILDWFGYFLKDNKECEWISTAMGKINAP